jgi:radical SAM superfamily enzyme YgiQ (UPF0313 family)
VLQDFEYKRLLPVYRHQTGFPSLATLPRPDWNLYSTKKYLPVHFVETTRGCPVDCDFCAVSTAFGGTYRNRPQPDVIQELRALKPFSGFCVLKNCVFFVDDNIISNRAYAREFLTRISELKLNWFGQASMNVANDPEILALCQKSGCRGLFIGFETLSHETLSAVGKKVNRPEKYYDVVQRIHDHGIGIDGSFVFGFDTDDDAVFAQTVEFVLKTKLEVAYFSVLTPYPGTRLYKRMVAENRLLTGDWSQYDANQVVFRPKKLTPEQLQQKYYLALKEVYSLRGMFTRLWGTPAWKNFFYPMNFGFGRSITRLAGRKPPLPVNGDAFQLTAKQESLST